ncbi:MAG: hypothetical protein HYV63_08960 [Candidatus Schekmanbacteria bacterium]|nr:hypothetical protein [Candidatus Schekmanbacteria bacterium]
MSIEATQSWHSSSADDVLRSLRVDIDAGLGAVVDAAVIFGVVAVNAVIGHLQESRAITR